MSNVPYKLERRLGLGDNSYIVDLFDCAYIVEFLPNSVFLCMADVEDIKNWCKNYLKFRYRVCYTKHVIIENVDDAVVFKLKWC